MQVGEVGRDWFSVYLIPETLRVTTIGSKGPGDLVNVEVDSQTQVVAPFRKGIRGVLWFCFSSYPLFKVSSLMLFLLPSFSFCYAFMFLACMHIQQ